MIIVDYHKKSKPVAEYQNEVHKWLGNLGGAGFAAAFPFIAVRGNLIMITKAEARWNTVDKNNKTDYSYELTGYYLLTGKPFVYSLTRQDEVLKYSTDEILIKNAEMTRT